MRWAPLELRGRLLHRRAPGPDAIAVRLRHIAFQSSDGRAEREACARRAASRVRPSEWRPANRAWGRPKAGHRDVRRPDVAEISKEARRLAVVRPSDESGPQPQVACLAERPGDTGPAEMVARAVFVPLAEQMVLVRPEQLLRGRPVQRLPVVRPQARRVVPEPRPEPPDGLVPQVSVVRLLELQPVLRLAQPWLPLRAVLPLGVLEWLPEALLLPERLEQRRASMEALPALAQQPEPRVLHELAREREPQVLPEAQPVQWDVQASP